MRRLPAVAGGRAYPRAGCPRGGSTHVPPRRASPMRRLPGVAGGRAYPQAGCPRGGSFKAVFGLKAVPIPRAAPTQGRLSACTTLSYSTNLPGPRNSGRPPALPLNFYLSWMSLLNHILFRRVPRLYTKPPASTKAGLPGKGRKQETCVLGTSGSH